MDALFHGRGWVKRPEYEADVAAFTAQERWITDSDGYHTYVGELVLERADTFVWLDYSRWRCEWRVLRRSIARGVMRRELWNGNRESLLRLVRDPDHPVRWSWVHHAERRERSAHVVADPRFAHLTSIRLATPRRARTWLSTL